MNHEVEIHAVSKNMALIIERNANEETLEEAQEIYKNCQIH